MFQQDNPDTNPVAPTPTSPRPGSPAPDTPSPDAPDSDAPDSDSLDTDTFANRKNPSIMKNSKRLAPQKNEPLRIVFKEHLEEVRLFESDTLPPEKKISRRTSEDDIPGTSGYIDREEKRKMREVMKQSEEFLRNNPQFRKLALPDLVDNKATVFNAVNYALQSISPSGKTEEAIRHFASIGTLVKNVVIISIGRYAMEMADAAIENLEKFNILDTFVFAEHGIEKESYHNCHYFNGPKDFKSNYIGKDYENPTEKVIEAIKKYDEQYHVEEDYGNVYPAFIFLISHGGEDLFFSQREPIAYGIPRMTLEQKVEIVNTFKAYNATNEDIGRIRRLLSRVKGGGILSYIKNGYSHGFYMPDFVDDTMDNMSGGPTIVPEEPEEDNAARNIMKRLEMKLLSTFKLTILDELETPNDYEQPGPGQHKNKLLVTLPDLFKSIFATMKDYKTCMPFEYQHGSTKNIGKLFTEVLCSKDLKDNALMRNATNPLPTSYPMALHFAGEFGPMDALNGGLDFTSDMPIHEMMHDFLVAFEEKEPEYEFTYLCVATGGQDNDCEKSGIVVSNEDVRRLQRLKDEGRMFLYNSFIDFWEKFNYGLNRIKVKPGSVDFGTIHILTLHKSLVEENKMKEELERKRREEEEELMDDFGDEEVVEVDQEEIQMDEDVEAEVEDTPPIQQDKEQNNGIKRQKKEITDELLRGDGTVWNGDPRKDPYRKTAENICLVCGIVCGRGRRWAATARQWACNDCGNQVTYYLQKKKKREKEEQDQMADDSGDDNGEEAEEMEEDQEEEEEEEVQERTTRREITEKLLRGDGSVFNGDTRNDPLREEGPQCCLACGKARDKTSRWVETARKWTCNACRQRIYRYHKAKKETAQK